MKKDFDHIDELIGKYLADEASQVERALVEEWIALDKINQSQFDHFKLIFDRAKAVPLQAFDTEKAWLKVKSKISNQAGRTVSLAQFWTPLRIAAALIVAVGLSYFAYQQLSTPDQVVTIAAKKTIVSDTLPDGSLAVLNKNTTIKYVYNSNSNERKVSLEGEAFFEVNHQPDKPFIIETGEVFVEDIGTTFNVNASPDKPTVEVYVETGEVAFYSLNNAGLNLVAGETGVYHKENKSFARLLKVDTNKLAYKTGIFSFRNSDLQTIIEELNSVYDLKVKLRNESLKNCRLTVTFSNEKIEDIVEIIAETLKLTLTKDGDEYILNGQSCGD